MSTVASQKVSVPAAGQAGRAGSITLDQQPKTFALSSIIFLLPYVLMFPALLVLRARRADTPRPYLVPGGKVGAWVSVLLCEAGVVFAIIAFFWLIPQGTPKLTYWGITAGGTVLSVVIGWWLGRRASSSSGALHPFPVAEDA